jgi:hypothetical protein
VKPKILKGLERRSLSRAGDSGDDDQLLCSSLLTASGDSRLAWFARGPWGRHGFMLHRSGRHCITRSNLKFEGEAGWWGVRSRVPKSGHRAPTLHGTARQTPREILPHRFRLRRQSSASRFAPVQAHAPDRERAT